jgi:plasmid maintenance system antidote protein VapI
MKQFLSRRVESSIMNPKILSNRTILNEDLQIVRATLQAIVGDVRKLSQESADAIQEALGKLDRALQEFPGVRSP